MLTDFASTDLTSGFARLDYTSMRSVLCAVSGGSDSTALLLLTHHYLRSYAPGVELRAATIDHGLRPESAAEAAGVAALCAKLGIPHVTKRWCGPARSTGLQARARDARYSLLAAAAREQGCDAVFVGHTANDQAETVAMRRMRGGGGGLAGIPEATLAGRRIWFVRPLLGLERTRLRAWLTSQGVCWFDDPSNQNPGFERVRVREALGGLRTGELLALAAREAESRRARALQAALLVARHARPLAPGLVLVDRATVEKGGDAVVEALRTIAAAMGGSSHRPPHAHAADPILRAIARRGRSTLCGSVIDSREAGLFLHREYRGGGPVPDHVRPGDIWDGRFLNIGDREIFVAPAGGTLKTSAATGPASRALRAAAGRCEPQGQGGDSIEHLQRVAGFWARLVPDFDLPLAAALAQLFGNEELPAPPITIQARPPAGHNRGYA